MSENRATARCRRGWWSATSMWTTSACCSWEPARLPAGSIFAENVTEDLDAARAHYDSALKVCRADGDLLLESFVVRHLGGLAIDSGDQQTGVDLLRRSLHLRAALGARPLTAAAQATLASFLPDGPERETLREASAYAGRELGIPWL